MPAFSVDVQVVIFGTSNVVETVLMPLLSEIYPAVDLLFSTGIFAAGTTSVSGADRAPAVRGELAADAPAGAAAAATDAARATHEPIKTDDIRIQVTGILAFVMSQP
jgi:hypothetical protein